MARRPLGRASLLRRVWGNAASGAIAPSYPPIPAPLNSPLLASRRKLSWSPSDTLKDEHSEAFKALHALVGKLPNLVGVDKSEGIPANVAAQLASRGAAKRESLSAGADDKDDEGGLGSGAKGAKEPEGAKEPSTVKRKHADDATSAGAGDFNFPSETGVDALGVRIPCSHQCLSSVPLTRTSVLGTHTSCSLLPQNVWLLVFYPYDTSTLQGKINPRNSQEFCITFTLPPTASTSRATRI